MLRELLAQLQSVNSLGFPGISGMAKELAYTALLDPKLSTCVLLSGFTSKDSEIIDLSIQVYWTVVKKSIERSQIDILLCNVLLPIIISISKDNSKARELLGNLHKKMKQFYLFQTFVNMFSKDKLARSNAYSNIFKLEFFDQCLSFESPANIVSNGNVILPDMTSQNATFSDPLQGIMDQTGRLAFVDKLSAFQDKSGKQGRITQAQIKSLYELLDIAVNSNLEINVRGVALDQINEAVYFYRESVALKDFCKQILGICRDNLNEFGGKRENFSMVLANLKPLDESFISSKSASDLPIQNKFYSQEKLIAAKFLAIYNSVLHHARQLQDERTSELEHIFGYDQNKGLCRSLWILATERNIEHRYQALLLLNLIFLSGLSTKRILGEELIRPKQDDIAVVTSCILPILDYIEEDYFILFQGNICKLTSESHPFHRLEESSRSLAMKFIDKFHEVSVSKENRHLGFDPEVNKEGILNIMVQNRLQSSMEVYMKSLRTNKQLSGIKNWINYGLVATFAGHSEIFEDKEIYMNYFSQLRELISQGKDEVFQEANNLLTNLIESQLFQNMYQSEGALRSLVEQLTLYYHEKILPMIYEIHVDSFAEKHDLILSILNLMTQSIKLALKSNDQKLLMIIRGFVTKATFIEFLSDLLRKYEAMDILSATLVKFVRWHFDIFLGSTAQATFLNCVQFMFDSALICTRTDNFVGISRLFNVLKLAHSISSRNQLIALTGKKEIFEDVKNMKKEDLKVPVAFKTSTIAWIVSLLDHRCISVRMVCWNLIANYLDASLLELFPSLIDNAVATLNLVNEAAGVASLCYIFLTKCCKLVSSVSAIGAIGDEYGHFISKDQFVQKLHDRKAIEAVRRIIAQLNGAPILLASSIRFAIEWFSLDPGSLVNKYFHSDFLDKALQHLDRIDNTSHLNTESGKSKQLTEQLSSLGVLMNFLVCTTKGYPANSNALIKNFDVVRKTLKWLAYCSRLFQEPVLLGYQFSQETNKNIHGKNLERSVIEFSSNCIQLLEVLSYESKQIFIEKLDQYEKSGEEKDKLMDTLSDLLINDNCNTNLGYSLLKLLTKVLLQWDYGYCLLDREQAAASIADSLTGRCMVLFKSIDYLKMAESDYLKIINTEELMHMLGVLIAKSDLMKERFLTSGLFQIYIEKFLQIIHSFKRNINYVSRGSDKKEQMQNQSRLQNKANRLNSSTISNSKTNSGRGMARASPELGISTKTTKLNQNIRQITENSSGHIKAYIQIAKYFFHNSLHSNSQTTSKTSLDLLEARMGDILEIVHFLWQEGQADDVGY